MIGTFAFPVLALSFDWGLWSEYAYTLQVDEKSDIYSYGVVLLEILTGKRSVDAEFGDGNSIVDWVRSKIKSKNGFLDTLDKNAGALCASVREEMMLVLRIALICTSRNPADRPTMRDVVSMLQEAKPKRKLPGGGVTGGGGGEENGTACDAVPLARKPPPIIEC
nr:leucine-rich repeat receptor-like protein kinase TDR [Coffea arabica]